VPRNFREATGAERPGGALVEALEMIGRWTKTAAPRNKRGPSE